MSVVYRYAVPSDIAFKQAIKPEQEYAPVQGDRFRYTKLTADESAAVLTGKIRAQEPFIFLRYGDGALECIGGSIGCTRDFEDYSPALGKALLDSWDAVINAPNVYIGDWLSASFDPISEYSRYEMQYAALIGDARPNWLHFETLLLMRDSPEIVDFYRAVKQDSRRKVFMGPAGNRGAAKMLGADFIETPMDNLLAHTGAIADELIARDFDVLLYGAGMAGTIPVVRCWERHPTRTYVNVGSAMDTLFRGSSRRFQLHSMTARALFQDLL